MNKVFVALDSGTLKGMRILGWVFDHFQNDTTQLILACLHTSDNDRAGFLKFAKSTYLPRCTTEKFQTEIYTTEEINMEAIILEMTTKQGMQELVLDDYWWRNISQVLNGNADISCKIWALDRYTGKVNNTRDTKLDSNLNARLNELTSDIEKLPDTTISVFLRAVTTAINRKLKIKKESENNLHGQEPEQLEEKIRFLTMENEQLKLENLQSKNKFEENLTKMQEEKTKHFGPTSDFTLQELEEATQNFSDSLKIGQGGFGSVYKGNLHGRDVAIKTLNSQSTQPILAFKQEVAILSTMRHPNIVTLLGACHNASALVFEFLPNGSLESHLECANKATSLTWQIRTRIMAEISLALIFLHSNAENMIVHGDLKPDNILLDAKFVSKLGDFGISRFLKKPDSDSTACYETNHPAGTTGYIDPEFQNSGMLTEKSDVYSFGVVILRLLTRKPAMCIALHVETAIENGTFLEILDASAGEWPLDQAKELAKLAIRCAQVARKARPNLFEVWPIIERLRRNL